MSRGMRLLRLVLGGVTLGIGLAVIVRAPTHADTPWSAIVVGLLIVVVGTLQIALTLRRPTPASHPCADCLDLHTCDLRRDLEPGECCHFARTGGES